MFVMYYVYSVSVCVDERERERERGKEREGGERVSAIDVTVRQYIDVYLRKV